MTDFPNIRRALMGAIRFTATIVAIALVLAFVNRLAGIAYPGTF